LEDVRFQPERVGVADLPREAWEDDHLQGDLPGEEAFPPEEVGLVVAVVLASDPDHYQRRLGQK